MGVAAVVSQLRDVSGSPYSGMKAYVYAAGTSTPSTVYTDASKVTEATNPVIANSMGLLNFYLDADGSTEYKIVVKTSDDATTLYSKDNLPPEDGIVLTLFNLGAEGVILENLDAILAVNTNLELGASSDILNAESNAAAAAAAQAYIEGLETEIIGLHGLSTELGYLYSIRSTLESLYAGEKASSSITYTANETGATERTLDEILADYPSVKDFGAVGLGDGTNDYDAFVAAFEAHDVVVVPPGQYKLNSQLVIQGSRKRMIGYGSGASEIFTNDGVIMRRDDDEGGDYSSHNGLHGVAIKSAGLVTTATGLEIYMTSSMEMYDVLVQGFETCLDAIGVKELQALNCSFSAYGFSGTPTTGAGVVQFRSGLLSDGITYRDPWYPHFANVTVGGATIVDYAIKIEDMDGGEFANMYVANATDALLFFSISSVTAANAAVCSFSSCYFDGVNATNGCQHSLKIDSAGNALINELSFIGCFMGNTQSHAAVLGSDAGSVRFTGGNIRNVGAGHGIYAAPTATNDLRLVVSGMHISNLGVKAAGAYDCVHVDNADTVILTGVEFKDNAISGSYGINLNGTIGRFVANGVTAENVDTFFDDSGATIGVSSWSACVAGDASSDLFGFKSLNKPSSDSSTLDFYREVSFTPEVRFGGSSTGVTYSNRVGRATRIGNVVHYTVYVALSSKGTDTGVLTIGDIDAGTSLLTNDVVVDVASVRAFGMASGVTNSSLVGIVEANDGTIRIDKGNGSGITQLTDADCTNSTTLTISGTYFVA